MRAASAYSKISDSRYCFLLFVISFFLLASCTLQRKIERAAEKEVLSIPALKAAHVGISIFEPATNSYWYNYQGDKYFVPASNTKIPTCYAAMKYLGDSLVGLRYGVPDKWKSEQKFFIIEPAGDPTFLLPEYKNQPVFEFLRRACFGGNSILAFLNKNNKVIRWGNGWSWNDYESDYMAERSSFPIFGNLLNIKLLDTSARVIQTTEYPYTPQYKLFTTGVRFFDTLINRPNVLHGKQYTNPVNPTIQIHRDIGKNSFSIAKSVNKFNEQVIPFVTNDYYTALAILQDSLKFRTANVDPYGLTNQYLAESDDLDFYHFQISKWNTIHSQPTDSLLKPMMHRSDNFFAEQALLMVSNEKLGLMNDEKIIDTLLKTDFKDLPQKPRWADGSGLSRYNLFTPQDMVAILHKMKNEFGMERLKVIFPTGGEGTINNYYKSDSGYIYGKTGTLSGVVAFSGFVYTQKGKLLIFSTLVNNHRETATAVRRAIESFLQEIRAKY